MTYITRAVTSPPQTRAMRAPRCGRRWTLRTVRRRGFVLLAVLWVMVGVAALGLGLTLAARRVVRSSRNRRDAAVAAWLAEDCAERARAAIAAVLAMNADGGAPGAAAAGTRWRTLDAALDAATLGATSVAAASGCTVSLTPAGRTVNVNTADEEQLHRFFTGLGLPAASVDSLVDALLDWRDPDDVPRPMGAEHDWYARESRAPPRNGPLADVRELRRVRGFAPLIDAVGLDTLLGVDPARIDLERAPLPVLASLPGMGDEAIARMSEHRFRGVAITDLLAFSAELSRAGRAALVARFPDLVRLTTTEPDAWLLTSRAHLTGSSITAVIELRLVRAGTRAAIVRRRTWVE